MAELYPSDSELSALSATVDAGGLPHMTIAQSPFYIHRLKLENWLARALASNSNALRVYKDGDLTFGVRAGKFLDGDTVRNYAGASEQALTNNQTNYIYVIADGTLTVNTTGFPTPSTTPHIPLATILTATGEYDHDDVTDYRGRAFLSLCSGLTASDIAEALTFFAATDISGAEAETLTDTSNADALHVHDTAGIEAGAITDTEVNAAAAIAGSKLQALSLGANAGAIPSTGVANAHVADDAAIARSKLAQEAYATYLQGLCLCRQADGTPLPATAAGGSFGIDSGGWGTGTLKLKAEEANSNQKTDTLLVEFCLPPEYVDGAAVKLALSAKYNTAGSPTLTTKTIDVECYEGSGLGGVGADICATAAITLTDSWATCEFTITPTALVAGDMLQVLIQTDLVETGGVAAWAEIGKIRVACNIKG